TRSSAIIASIGFDRDCEYFATAGVNNRIRVQSDRPDSRSLTDDGLLPHYYPTYELTCRNKISCLSWNPYVKSLIANSDYTGVVTLWDAHTGVETLTWSEHAKRIWSLDFSRTDPNRLASGGDDTKVKIWCMRQSQSALTLDGRANVCCVQFNPTVSHCLALGTADHHIYYYDLRNPNTPVTTLKGHRKAVSFVRFINGRELVSASIDNTLTHGIPESNPLGIGQRTYRGHTNEKNFVGLSVRNDWITCGSETNCVFTYHRALSQPVFRTPFDQELPSTTNQVLPTPTNPATPSFVSAVCWKPDADVLLAASSHGTIRTFHL
ncbi:WD40-repeat-containing domain protein, partial [Dimargaris cristalligena]